MLKTAEPTTPLTPISSLIQEKLQKIQIEKIQQAHYQIRKVCLKFFAKNNTAHPIQNKIIRHSDFLFVVIICIVRISKCTLLVPGKAACRKQKYLTKHTCGYYFAQQAQLMLQVKRYYEKFQLQKSSRNYGFLSCLVVLTNIEMNT